jgi:hypothetical protein
VSQLTCQLAENHVTLCQFKKIFASWQRFYEALPIFAIGKKSLAERGFGRKAFYPPRHRLIYSRILLS